MITSQNDEAATAKSFHVNLPVFCIAIREEVCL